ncbi:MAG: DUF4251 domain-containing protein [Bacteroidales bacterium]
MKTIKMNVGLSLFLITGFLGISIIGNSQEQKLSRQEIKEAKKAQLVANFYALDTLLNMRTFVLEADFLQNKYGTRVPVSSDLNFIKVNRSNGILQTGSNFGMGYNGIGGVTAEGSISSWKLFKDDKRLIYTLQFSLFTELGHYDIVMTVSSDNRASATITGLGPNSLTWDGHLEAIYNSRVYKGQNSI